MSQANPTLNSSSLAFVEEMYSAYLDDPSSVPPEWREYFMALANGDSPANGADNFRSSPSFRPRSLFNPPGGLGGDTAENQQVAAFQYRVDKLVRNYRVRGHRIAQFNPLGSEGIPNVPELSPEFYGLTEADMDRPVIAENMPGVKTLSQLLEGLRSTYTRSIGVQFMHIDNLAVRSWLQERMETTRNRLDLPRATQVRILTRLTDAEIFEEFIQRSEEHTSELQSRGHLVCRLLLAKKKHLH